MRTFSLFTILLLCLGILFVDILAFFWLHSITSLLESNILRTSIHVLYWVFTVGLIVSILTIKITLDDINPLRKQLLISRFYGLAVSSFIPKLIFVIIVSIFYFSNYFFSDNESILLIALVGLFSGFLPFFIILYGVFKAVYRFKVYHQIIKHSLLPQSFHGLKVIQISDLHLGSFNYKFKKLNEAIIKINQLKPDIIVMTGDLVNNYAWELRGWARVFRKLQAKKGKYAIFGNHDYGDYSEWESNSAKEKNFEDIKQFFKNIDFKLLLNQSETIKNTSEEIAIIGVENWGKPPFKQYGDLDLAIQNVKDIQFKILLSHDPSHWTQEIIDKTDIALTLSGHTHGMQAAFQYKNLQWSPIKYKFKHWAGLYRHNKQYLYVNRGLGWLGFPARIGMRPEITAIELQTKD
ncbi:metallophosphoesterase [Winogradskyella sp.]|uniref:metallophosphoesterase n=1 Tax=Winogradskyella sp. TaxID=1883156 RepID=UPI003F6BDF79